MTSLSAYRCIDRIIAYEEGDLSDEDTIALFQELIDSGLAWSLQGHYGRTAHRLILAGICQPPSPQGDRGMTTELREARIILPKGYPEAGIWLQGQFCVDFGGFTHFEGLGGWLPPGKDGVVEPVHIYDVAVPSTEESEQTLLRIARHLREAASQDAIYLRFPSGCVLFVKD